MPPVEGLLLLLFLSLFPWHFPQASALRSRSPSPWHTLSGDEPAVVARGGFSGIFPDSSQYAYELAMQTSLSNVILWCDVQLTKDGHGVCLPSPRLNNCTAVKHVLQSPPRKEGWFSVDLTLKQLSDIPLTQGIFSRTDKFDGFLPILSLEYLYSLKPQRVWLNIQDDLLFSQHNLSMKQYITSLPRHAHVDYISSPKIAFLRSIAPGFRKSRTKVIFSFLDTNATEPSTKQTYASLLNNFTFIKTFASGILIPKNYIWPVDSDLYLLPHTSIVSDAHSVGLEVFASNFANDALIAYNYSYDPVAEYLSFVDNGNFSVDGVLSDHPVTASAAIGCFSHLNTSSLGTGHPLVISHNGASGIYPGCTDLAYKKAVEDGADYIDCTVQVTKDGVLMCLSSADLMESTTVAASAFSIRSSTIPEIQSGPGTFTFNLTWEEIQKKLKPMILSPQYRYRLLRNPSAKNSGEFMKLTDFLAFAKDASLSGVLISVENGAFFAEKLGVDMVESVLQALNDSGYGNSTSQKVRIMSTDSSVLKSFKQRAKHRLVYKVDELIGNALSSTVQDIETFADAVAVSKKSVFPASDAFITSQTMLVQKLQSASLAVYVYVLMNEFTSQPWDFFSDPYMEVNTYFQGASVDGIITDFPATASSYRRNTCLRGNKSPSYMLPVQPGGLITLMSPSALPPALAPYHSLTVSDVVEPPLPPAVKPRASTSVSQPPEGGTTTPGGQPRTPVPIVVALALCFGALLLMVGDY